jgi:ribonuclease P protein component
LQIKESKNTFLSTTNKKVKETFKKEERLSEKKLIESLFKDGKTFYKFPFKVFYYKLEEAEAYPAKVLISVSKRNFKRAVDRNHIKRLVREAYRKNKNILCEASNTENCRTTWVIGLIHTGNVIPEYEEVEKKIILILQELLKNEQAAV